MYSPMKRGDIVKYTPADQMSPPILGLILSVGLPSNVKWNDFMPKRIITLVDFDGVQHKCDLWTDTDVEIVSK